MGLPLKTTTHGVMRFGFTKDPARNSRISLRAAIYCTASGHWVFSVGFRPRPPDEFFGYWHTFFQEGLCHAAQKSWRTWTLQGIRSTLEGPRPCELVVCSCATLQLGELPRMYAGKKRRRAPRSRVLRPLDQMAKPTAHLPVQMKSCVWVRVPVRSLSLSEAVKAMVLSNVKRRVVFRPLTSALQERSCYCYKASKQASAKQFARICILPSEHQLVGALPALRRT